MKKGNRLLVILMVILLFSTLGACVEGKGPVPVFTLDKTSIELTAGGNSEALTLTIANVEETPAWESSDESVATVTVGETANVATVRGLAEGTAVITAKAGEQVAVCTVNVLKGPYITVLTEEITVAEGATEIIKVDTNIEGLNYTSENEEIATVDVQGVVSGIAEGTAEITVTGLNQSATVKVTVVKPYVKLNTDEVIMRLGQEEEVRLTAESNGKVVWSSSDENIVTVNNGVLTAVSVGEAVVTAKYAGATAECVVKVKSEIVTVTLSETELTVEKDGSAQLTVTLSPEQEGDDALINWSVVSGEDVVSVSEDGTVTSLGIYGTAVVRATLAKDTDCYAECTVTVPDPYADWLAISDRESFEAAFKSGNTEKNMYLVGDIDLGGAEYGAVLMSGYYNGTIEGRGYEIYNFSTVGLFDGLAENALIKDLAITCSVANMGGNFGIFGLELNGTVQNCRIDITFGSTPFQSVFGRNAKGNVSNTIILARNPLNTNNVFAGCVQGGGKWNSVYYAVYGGNVNAAGPTLKSEEALTQSSLYEDWNTEIWNIVDGEIPVHKNGGNIGELKVELGVTDAIIHLGDTLAVVATVKPAKLPAADKTVVWTSSDEEIATVDENGYITLKKAGTVVITATSVKDGEKSASCAVTVIDIEPFGIYLDKTELSVFAGETGKLTLTILPVLATEEQKQVKWESSDETIATVNGNGVVTGLKVGNVTITVTSLYDETQTVTCAVTVLGARDANIELDTERRSLHIGGSGAAWKVGATLDPMPLEPAAADVVWESSDSSIVSVTAAFENGKHYGVLTTLAAGKVTITAKLASDGMILDTCEIDSFTNENNARPLSTPAEFKAMATGQSYYLTDDIDFSGIEITASYTGNLNSVTLDGRGYALRNIKTNFTSNEQGFIHMLVGLTTIKNVGFYFELGGSGNFQFGGLIRQIDGSAKLENCYFEGTITARHADAKLGPIGSFFGAGSISNCIFNVNFGGNEGLNATNPHLNPRAAIARAFNSNISNCYVNKTLIGDAKVYAAGNGDGAGEKLADGLKTEEELKAAATFDDSWSAWVIEEGSYPRLRTAFDN